MLAEEGLVREILSKEPHRGSLHRELESRGDAGRHRRLEGPAERTAADLEDAQQPHGRLSVEHGIGVARLAVPGQQDHHLQQILPGRIHVEGRPVLERQTDALVLRGRGGQHLIPPLLQPVPGRSDARLHRGLPVHGLSEPAEVAGGQDQRGRRERGPIADGHGAIKGPGVRDQAVQRLHQRAVPRGHRSGDGEGVGASVGPVYQLVLSDRPRPIAFHTEQRAVSKIFPRGETHLEEDEEVLSPDGHGRCDERVDHEAREQKSGPRDHAVKQAGGCYGQDESFEQTGHSLRRAEVHRESYLRFCSQKFCLTNFHESIHLCNHAIQCKYTNCGDRDPALPSDNMWDATTFKEFLKSQGHDKAWDEMIYPGMKQGLVGSLLASQEAMDRRKNSFELYGADFMVMEDFSVWLIEINSHPDMSYSSRVTTRLCRQVLEDTVKVVIDFREDKNASTGEFELAYRQRMPSCQPYLGAALSLQGTRITSFEKKSSCFSQDSKVSLSSKSPMTCLTKKKSTMHTQIGPVIVDLIEELEIQLDQEFYAYYKVDSPKFRQALPSTAVPKPLKTTILVDKQESTVKSAPTSVRPNAKTKSTAAVQNGRIVEKSGSSQRAPSRTPRKSRAFTGSSNNKIEGSPARQTLISKIMGFQKQSTKVTPKSDKPAKGTQEKIIKSVVRDAIKKYKKSATLAATPSDVPALPSLQSTNKANEVATGKNKNRSVVPKKNVHQRKNKVLTDITDMYAVGLRLTK
ncbi:uncharacterized protein LOC143358263 isoform X2 [Halictus rubicundus]|uniref:uncharacterized protein LOC143358263 isoform X2 n=1 Tax=Halictus rubicundus TaxID=77578 RepID=UPI0040365F78